MKRQSTQYCLEAHIICRISHNNVQSKLVTEKKRFLTKVTNVYSSKWGQYNVSIIREAEM